MVSNLTKDEQHFNHFHIECTLLACPNPSFLVHSYEYHVDTVPIMRPSRIEGPPSFHLRQVSHQQPHPHYRDHQHGVQPWLG